MGITDSMPTQQQQQRLDFLTPNRYRDYSKNKKNNDNDNGNDNNPEYKWKPKITVKCKHFLYHLTYSEILNTHNNNTSTKEHDNYNARLLKIKTFNIMVYIDIPTIDYYLDELKDNKLSKFNKKFKLNKLKYSIWKSFTNNNPEFWDKFILCHRFNENNESPTINCNLSIKSSGSLRYVETIKFLIETIYDTLLPYNNIIKLKIDLNVSKISSKWFKNFLKKPILNYIRFKEVLNSHLSPVNSSDLSIIDFPFKEYFNKLNEKFSFNENKPKNSDAIDTIIVITNSMGIKALLTILADKPLTNFIDQRSIDEFYNDSLSKSNTNSLTRQISNNSSTSYSSASTSTTVSTCSYPNDLSTACDTNSVASTNINDLNNINNNGPVGGALRRELSSLLNFQKTVLTSNKDKSVRIRSLSINRRTGKLLEPHLSKIPFKTQLISNHKEPFETISRTKDILQLIDQEDIHQLEKEANINEKLKNKRIGNTRPFDSDQPILTDDEDIFISGDEFSEDDEEEEEDYSYDDESDDNDEGISFYVPSLLSRSGSSSDINSLNTVPYLKKGRFRSLSLMDSAQRQPFNYDKTLINLENNHDNSDSNNQYIENAIGNGIAKPKPNSFTNIYIHDGNFNDTYTSKHYKRKYNNNFNSNIVNIYSNTNTTPINPNLNGLIPPEFYTRFSTPSLSNHNSTSSLNSTYLSPYYTNNENTSTPGPTTSRSQINIFEKNLINKSFELNRSINNSGENIFNKLINKKNEERNKHFTLMNFSEREFTDDNNNNSDNIKETHDNRLLRELEEEDQMIGTVQEDNIAKGILQKPPSGIPYKIHGSTTTSGSNLTLFNYNNSDTNTVKPISKQSTLTQLNLSLYSEDEHLLEDSKMKQKDFGNYIVASEEPEVSAFRRIASLNLYGSDDEQSDEYSSNIWVLGGNR